VIAWSLQVLSLNDNTPSFFKALKYITTLHPMSTNNSKPDFNIAAGIVLIIFITISAWSVMADKPQSMAGNTTTAFYVGLLILGVVGIMAAKSSRF